ncbi:MAG TPA: hypothetical protein VH328_08060 [Burkholderiaceae bacterium]|nr:hypothetical protein [Burkholderiaceae bacterium]
MTDPLDGVSKDAPRPDVFQGAPADAPGPRPGNAPSYASRSVDPSRRGPAWRLAGWWLLVSVVLLVVCAIGAGIALQHSDLQPMHVIINGDDVGGGLTIESAGPIAKVALGVAGVAAVLLVLLLVPIVLALVGGIVMLALVIGLGVPIVGLAMALTLLTSPIWLVWLFVWLLARRRRAFAHATSATIAA